ncbi:MAG: GH36-type glycosyl hydrolase domain-containing protein [Patescibacteria group bacterium]
MQVLGFYQDPDAAAEALRELGRGGFRRAAGITVRPDGRIRIRTGGLAPAGGAVAGIILGLLGGYAAGPGLAVILFAAAAGLFLGALAARLGHGLDATRYRRWVMPGESLVAVHAPSREIGKIAALMRRAGGMSPAVFVLRRQGIPAAPAHARRRGEDYCLERLVRHAAELAAEHETAPAARRGDALRRRLETNRRSIDAIARELGQVAGIGGFLAAGSEWFLDNTHLIRGQSAGVERCLSPGFLRELPVLARGPRAGLPRVYALAEELVAHTGARLERETIAAFLGAYQRRAPLNSAEIGAVPAMLALALLERANALGIDVFRRQIAQEQADFWAHRLLIASRRGADQLLFTLAELARAHPGPEPSFAVHLAGKLHDEPGVLIPLRGWLERKSETAVPEMLREEEARQAADQHAIANTVGGLRFLSRVEWPVLLEEASPVEEALRADPAGAYAEMDACTRGNYRRAVEEIARRARASELETARRAVSLAQAASPGARENHVGFFLIDRGRPRLETAVGARPGLRTRLERWIRRRHTVLYLGGAALCSAVLLGAALCLAAGLGTGAAALVLLGLAGVLPAAELALGFLNLAVTRLLPPSSLPRMSFAKGIPDEYRTLVAVPMMLLTPASIQSEIDRLEVRYLANPDANLYYALVSDFGDAPAAEMREDAELLRLAAAGIARLNARYGAGRFFLFHRRRRFCQSEGCYIGWERKRGKIEDLNAYLRREAESADLPEGSRAVLRSIRYVITLDSDTQLPRGTAKKLVATLAHPLNQARLSSDGRRVADGYTIIQPRVSTSLPHAYASRFTRIFADPRGMDPYCTAVSDVYQDLTGEGTYYGKGIYDLRAFDTLLGGVFPEATILSHDLLEGAYARVGFAGDIELFDLFPLSYQVYMKRLHRWVRGDWQIAGWIRAQVPGHDGRVRNPLSIMNRWKILDNLRRSLVPPALLAMLLVGWGSAAPAFWSAAAGIVLLMPTIIALLTERASLRATLRNLLRGLLAVALLPHRAGLALDAVARVWYRTHVSRRRLLEWETAQMAHWRWRAQNGAWPFHLQLIIYSLGAVALGTILARRGVSLTAAAVPYLVLWAAAPFLGWLLNETPRPENHSGLNASDQRFLRAAARRTWRFFQDFVNAESNWLPPDNYQEMLRVEVARRTSPTNIGLWLLSALAAYDLGYLPPDLLLDRAAATFDTLGKLELYEGHLLNWYDTTTLEPLRPRYVSTVDSGNLMASLWAFAVGCREIPGRPLLAGIASGLADALSVMGEHRGGLQPAAQAAYDALREAVPGETVRDCGTIVNQLRRSAGLAQELASMLRLDGAADPDARYWAEQLAAEIAAWLRLSDACLPWLALLDAAPAGLDGMLAGMLARARAEIPTPAALAAGGGALGSFLDAARGGRDELPPDVRAWLDEIGALFARAGRKAREIAAGADRLAAAASRLADGMHMGFLYDEERRLFAVGYDVSERKLDTSYYDLLASEARLASFTAIARGDVPEEHWLALGRPFGENRGRTVLLSWNGSIFEYLMPLLLTKPFLGSLLHKSCRAAVAVQAGYGKRWAMPWGISEAAFSSLDRHRIYQYRAFGVPGLGLKRGLEDDLVVAPYASALALAVAPKAAAANLRRLARAGLYGRYGFYESIDYNRERGPAGERGVIVYAYMAHHQGMSLVAAANALHGNCMRVRFHADRRVRAAESLLYEQSPAAPVISEASGGKGPLPRLIPVGGRVAAQRPAAAETPIPMVCLLGNGSFNAMVTNAGGGYNRWRGLDLTRWRADTTRDAQGTFVYLRDLETGSVWSAAPQPLGRAAGGCHFSAGIDRAEFRRRDAGIETVMEVVVPPGDDAEIRRLTLINRSTKRRLLELTSYAELALAPHGADRAHPAFSKLFIETAALPESRAVVAWRRPRDPGEQNVFAAQILALDEETGAFTGFETDRTRFLGRNRDARDPQALRGLLSGASGAVLDPVFSLRCRVAIEPGERTSLAFVTAAADSRQGIAALVEKYGAPAAVKAAVEEAWTHGQLEMRHLGLQAEEVCLYQELAGHLLYPNPRLRLTEKLRRNSLSLERLWAHGISGDLPIITVSIEDAVDLGLVRQVLLVHAFCCARGVRADLAILSLEAAGYDQPLREALRRLIEAHALLAGEERAAGIHLLAANQLPEEERDLLLAAARVSLTAARGSLARQLAAPGETVEKAPRFKPVRKETSEPPPSLPEMALSLANGYGGFAEEGREYVIHTGRGAHTPAPWVNVMANPAFGCLISETGTGFCWSGNSQTNRLTPWSNDPVSDPAGIALYLRDEETGVYWSPTPQPAPGNGPYRTRHGAGYTVFEHASRGIEQELTVFVPAAGGEAAPTLLVMRLWLRNLSQRPRTLSITAYAEWTLGAEREETQDRIVTRWDAECGILLARNVIPPNAASGVAFAALSPSPGSYTADRTEFLGRNGHPRQPAAMGRKHLSGRTGAGLDPAAALQAKVVLEPEGAAEAVFLLGWAANVEQARALVREHLDPDGAGENLGRTRAFWDDLLSAVQVATPEPSLDVLLNRWLLYQTLGCRIWARSAFYQSGGAFGFRDQLQDVLALVHAAPGIAREHILRAAGRQFLEGDVQHWWHPPEGNGTRTRHADDPAWLPYAVTRYVEATGDRAILAERIPFLEGRALGADEHDAYFTPATALEDGTLLEHCRRALERALAMGPHGLPLIGTGDWNDGLNRVGAGGTGESVWLAWFLLDVLHGFGELCDACGEHRLAEEYRRRAHGLAQAVEAEAWDGDWYRRAYADDGSALGSRRNEEMRIDSLPQSWAAISGAGDQSRVARALASAEERLVRREDGLVLLFSPPFEGDDFDPGYIKGYPPGVRENGGQYTHAAIWLAMAHARRGDGDRAAAILRLLNPVERSRTRRDAELYQVEPFAVAADVHALPGKAGRGGWTWYTGSSAWMYRVWLEEILGCKRRGNELLLDPVPPTSWEGFTLTYRYGGTVYEITVQNPDRVGRGVAVIELDGLPLPDNRIPLTDDGARHLVTARMGRRKDTAKRTDLAAAASD